MAAEDQFKAQPDVGTLNMELETRADTKVTLDIDDAPFLKEEALPTRRETNELVLEESADADADADAEAEAKKKKKKKLIIIGGAVLLILVAVALWWFVLRTPPPKVVPLEPEIIRVPSAPKEVKPAEFIINFSPYWIELPDGKGGVVFLVCKFAAVTKNETLTQEAQNKMYTLRDAVYYYLKNKSYQFLIDPANVPTIKKDLASVLSGYLAGGQIDDMLFESYLGR